MQSATANTKDGIGPPSLDKRREIYSLLLILIPLLVVDSMIRNYLFDVSLPVLKHIRENCTTAHLDLFFLCVSQLGDIFGYSAVLVVAYYFLSVDKAFLIAIVCYTSIALLTILKSLIHEPRPFFVTTDFQPSKCVFEYGNPSGHALWTTSVYLSLFELAKRQNGWTRSGGYLHDIALGGTLFLILLTQFSRIWHGVHTFNQLLNGSIWGYAVHYLFCHILHYDISSFIRNIRAKSARQLLLNPGTLTFLSILLLTSALSRISFLVRPPSQDWLENMEVNCVK